MNPNLPILLTFELSPKQTTALRIICIRNGIQLIKADPAMYGETIGVLCGMDEAAGAPAHFGTHLSQTQVCHFVRYEHRYAIPLDVSFQTIQHVYR